MLNAVKKGIRDKLTGAVGVTSLLSSAGAIYWREAAQEAALDYIIYHLSGGGDTNDTPRDALDVRVVVKGVSGSSTDAGSIATAIREALHRKEISYEGGWKHIACQHESIVEYEERVAGQQFFYAGGIYRLRASK